MPRLAFCLAMLLPVSPALSGRSWIFVQPLPPPYEHGDRTACTTDRTAPVVDTILTLTHVGSLVYVAGKDNVANKGPVVMLDLLAGAAWFSSAIYGYSKTGECEAALEEDEQPVRYKPTSYASARGAARGRRSHGNARRAAARLGCARGGGTVGAASSARTRGRAHGTQQRDGDNTGARARPSTPGPTAGGPGIAAPRRERDLHSRSSSPMRGNSADPALSV